MTDTGSRSTLRHKHGSALADFLKLQFEPASSSGLSSENNRPSNKPPPATQDQAVREACVLIAHSLVAMLATLRAQIDVFDKRIAELEAHQPDRALFRSLPGAGDALVPRMIVAFGTQRDRYHSAYEMQCYSGIAPVTEASGNSQ